MAEFTLNIIDLDDGGITINISVNPAGNARKLEANTPAQLFAINVLTHLYDAGLTSGAISESLKEMGYPKCQPS